MRLKESDRLTAMAQGLNALGAEVEELPDGLTVYGKSCLTGGCVSGCNDHRVVMSLAVAALGCREPVTITGAECVAKSWPHFFTDFMRMGGTDMSSCVGDSVKLSVFGESHGQAIRLCDSGASGGRTAG